MSTKEKPLLHLVRGSGDPGVYCEDLDWFFGCYDYEALLRCSGFDQATFYTGNYRTVVSHPERDGELPKVKRTMILDDAKKHPYTDHHVNFGNSGVFTRGKRIWRGLSRMIWDDQVDMWRFYDPRKYFPPEFRAISEERTRGLHNSYYRIRDMSGLSKTLKRHAEEDEEEYRLCRDAERLVMRLDPGINCFSPAQFSSLAQYILPPEDLAEAQQLGKFAMGEIVIVRLTSDMVSQSELSRRTGMPLETIRRILGRSELKPFKMGNKNLFNLADVTQYLTKVAS